ncbi:hypothetical protein SESBI_16922 [Sesbania bispinosa]|nr:hypothetical protein SESBI_16922 [Sesbania bispinosa]
MNRVIVEAKGGQGEEQVHIRVCKSTRGQNLHNRAVKIFRTREAYNGYEEVSEKSTRFKIIERYSFTSCASTFQIVLIPVVFPLIIS